MGSKSLDSRSCAELKSMNTGFLQLLTWGGPQQGIARFGLPPDTLARLRALDADALEFIAGVPVLLSALDPPDPLTATRVADTLPEGGGYASGDGAGANDAVVRTDLWSRMTRLYTAAMLTWLWKLDRADRLIASLCLGSGQKMPRLSIPQIEIMAAAATKLLRARFADHPRFWTDLINAAASEDDELRELARFAALQLSLSRERQQPAG